MMIVHKALTVVVLPSSTVVLRPTVLDFVDGLRHLQYKHTTTNIRSRSRIPTTDDYGSRIPSAAYEQRTPYFLTLPLAQLSYELSESDPG